MGFHNLRRREAPAGSAEAGESTLAGGFAPPASTPSRRVNCGSVTASDATSCMPYLCSPAPRRARLARERLFQAP